MCKCGFDKGTWCSPLFGRPHPTASPAGEGMAARGGRARGAARACPLLFAEEVAPLTGPTGGNSPLSVSWEDGRQGRPKPAGQPLAHAAAGARGHLARGGKRPLASMHSRFPERVPAFARHRMPPHPPTHAAASANACRCIRQRSALHPPTQRTASSALPWSGGRGGLLHVTAGRAPPLRGDITTDFPAVTRSHGEGHRFQPLGK